MFPSLHLQFTYGSGDIVRINSETKIDGHSDCNEEALDLEGADS